MRRLLFLILAVSLTGCMVGPDYRRSGGGDAPVVPLRNQGRPTDGKHRLVAAVRRPGPRRPHRPGAGQQQDVKIAAANIEQAAGALTQVRSSLFPQVNYGASAARQRRSEHVSGRRPQACPTPRTPSSYLPGPAGRSTSGDASAGSPRQRAQTCSPRWRRAAA